MPTRLPIDGCQNDHRSRSDEALLHPHLRPFAVRPRRVGSGPPQGVQAINRPAFPPEPHQRTPVTPNPVPIFQSGGHSSPPTGNAEGVLPQSPGLRGSPRSPGCAWEECNNHNVVVPKPRMCGLPRTGLVATLKTHGAVFHSCGSGHPPPTSPDGATAQPLQGC